MINASVFRNSYIRVCLATIMLIIGGLIYVIFRSENLIMFSWFDRLDLSESITWLRVRFGGNDIYSWVKYNMPAALWLFAYLYVIDAIWHKHTNYVLYKPFFWIMPIIAILSEILQLLHMMPGTFDILDVMSYVFAVIIEASKKVFIRGKEYSFNDIMSCTFTDNPTTIKGKIISTTKSSTGSTVGRAIVGDIVAGPAGAIIGGTTGKKTTEFHQENDRLVHDYTVVININSIVSPILSIHTGTNGTLTNEIVGLMKVIISRK